MARDGDEPETKVEQPAPRGTAVFAPGDIVAGRYHIVRFIAEGGMGEVYEARDIELAEKVALKTIRGEYAKRPLLLGRFKREIHTARQVTHPNVCRVYDLGQHEGMLFLTMQLLAGDTLADVIERRKRIPSDEALPIARQIAAAIDAAHSAGIVHRDLKPHNVMLLAPPPGQTVPRAVVTDFGLARGHNDDAQYELSMSGQAAGSPAYMAPEQVQGLDIGPAADLYAFGIVLFEMITGSRPFEGGGTISVASRRLVEPPPSPRRYLPDLDERWEHVILRLLEREPADRFASAAEAITALQRPPPSQVRRQRRLRIAVGAAIAVAVGAVGGVVIVAANRHKPVAASTSRRAVAVFGFKNLAGKSETAWISSALSEMFTTELGGVMRPVSGQDVGRARMELKLTDTDAFNGATLGRIKADLDADVVIVGSYLVFGDHHDRMRLDVRIQDTRNGQTIATIGEQGDTADLPDLVERTGVKLREALDLAPSTTSQRTQLRAQLPKSRDAARLYAEGKDKLHRLEIVAARDQLEEASRLDPEHPMIRAALAEAWGELGYETKAREQAKLALAHADRLSPSEHTLVEARYHLSAHEWDPAIAAFRKLAAETPDDVNVGLQLAQAQIAAQRPKDALATLTQLHSDDPRINLESARAYSLLTDLTAQRDAAAAAAERAERSGAMLLAARARLEQASALLTLGEPAKSLEMIDVAERVYREAHEVRGLALATHARSLVFYVQGKLVEGDELEAKAASYYREVGAVQQLARALMNIGVMASRRSDSNLALRRFGEAIDVARSADDRWTLALALAGLADTERLLGHLDDARRDEAEALDHARATNSRRAEGYIIITLGQIALAQGDVAEAEKRARESLQLAESFPDPSLIAQCGVELGRARLEANDLLTSRDQLERALAEHTRAGDPVESAVAETELAEIELADGRAAEAIARAQHAATALDKIPTELAHSLAVLARAQLASGKLADAVATAAKADAAGKAAYPVGRIRAAIAIAAVQAAGGDAKKARGTLAAARTEADGLGLSLLAMYCELAQAELERAKPRLAVLAEQAKTRGLLRIAALAQK